MDVHAISGALLNLHTMTAAQTARALVIFIRASSVLDYNTYTTQLVTEL